AVAQLPAGAGVTFAVFAESYLYEHVRNLRSGTQRTQRAVIRRHLVPRYGALALHEITRALVQRWIHEMRDAGVPRKTAGSRVAILSAMLTDAFERGLACEKLRGLAFYADER